MKATSSACSMKLVGTHDRAEPHQRISQRHEAVRVAGENRNLVAAPDPARGEAHAARRSQTP